jgi:hypothetical protein
MWAEVVANKAKSAEAEPPRPPRSRAQSARDWAARLHIAARAARLDIDTVAAIAREEHQPGKPATDAKTQLAEDIKRCITTLQTIARNLEKSSEQ